MSIKTREQTTKNISFKIRGFRPIIMHNGRMADPLDPWTIKLKKLTSSKNKTDEHHEEIATTEFLGGIYYTPELGVYLPSENLQRMFLDSAKKTKMGKRSVAVTMIEPVGYPLEFPDCKNLEKLQKTPSMRFRKAVGVNGKRVIRTRPLIPTGWTCTISVELDTATNGLNPDEFYTIVENAGLYVGLGDWRPGAPKVPGGFGRFEITHFDGKVVA